MTEFLFSYGLFLAKVLTALIAFAFVIAMIANARGPKEEGPKLKITDLNRKYQEIKQAMLQQLLDKKEFKQLMKSENKEQKQDKKSAKVETSKPNLFVLNFDGDINASEVDTMRDEVTAVLSVAESKDQILLRLDNSGGVVHGHGLAASQLQRIKDAKIPFTVAVDKVAASGGYMMACVADKIIAAPFAILGSIGVLAQLPNFNRLLDKAGVDWEQHTAGEFKRTVTMFGKNTDKEREKLREELQDTHGLFREFVSQNRSKLDIDKVATGEHWYGKQALELNLVDELVTSDEYLVRALDTFNIYEVKMEIKKNLQEKLLGGFVTAWQTLANNLGKAQQNSAFR